MLHTCVTHVYYTRRCALMKLDPFSSMFVRRGNSYVESIARRRKRGFRLILRNVNFENAIGRDLRRIRAFWRENSRGSNAFRFGIFAGFSIRKKYVRYHNRMVTCGAIVFQIIRWRQ